MEPAEAQEAQPDIAGGETDTAGPSVASALERLGVAGQGVVTKRIDLALLEGHELLSRTVGSVALVGPGMVLAMVAWFAAAAAVVLVIAPAATPVVHLLIFGLLNGSGAACLVALGTRHGRSRSRVRPNGGA